MRIVTLFCLFLLFTSSITAQEKDYTEAFELIEAWLEAQKDYEDLPGISAAVVKDQQVIWANAYGFANPKNQIPGKTNTIYSICSISKLFTAVAIMQLYDAGKLRLDDPVSKLLPWFNLEQQYKDSGPITVRALMTHSSGLPRESDHPYWTGPDFPFPTEKEIRGRLGGQKTLYPAFTYFQYSNLGLTLLGDIVSEVSGKPYEMYVKENILDPLGLSNTRPYMPEDLWGTQLAKGFSATKRDGKRAEVAFFQAEGIAPAAGYSSTVEDLARFASWQFRLLEKGGKELLKASTLKEMQRVHWLDPDWGTSWGLGFAVYRSDGKKMVGHGGSCPGYRSTLALDLQDKMAYTVMINASGTNPGKYANGVRRILAKVKSNSKDSVTVDLKGYQGYYSSEPWWGETFVTPWNGKLAMLSLPNNSPEDFTLLKHIEGDVFRRIRDDDELGEEIRFERDGDGNIIRLNRNNNFSRKIR